MHGGAASIGPPCRQETCREGGARESAQRERLARGAAGKQVEVVRSERPIDCPYIGLDDGGVANERVVVRLVQTQRFAAVMLSFDCRDVIKTGQ